MATDTRANRLTAPDYIYIRLFIVSMFVRNHICEPKSVGTQRFGCVKAIKKKTLQRLIRLLYVDFAPRPASSSAYIFKLTYEPVGRNRKTPAEAHRSSKTRGRPWVLLDRDLCPFVYSLFPG
jgi:hypothetical protein